jgi:hypothetical protein
MTNVLPLRSLYDMMRCVWSKVGIYKMKAKGLRLRPTSLNMLFTVHKDDKERRHEYTLRGSTDSVHRTAACAFSVFLALRPDWTASAPAALVAVPNVWPHEVSRFNQFG